MGNRVTLQTIADRLGVSRTTVSNAYNRPDQLAPDLRERILAAARDLGYAGPDPAARRLRSGRRDAIGLLLGEELSYAFTDPAAVLLLQGIARSAEGAGLSLLLVPARGGGGDAAVNDAVVSAFGVYCMPADHPNLRAALERAIPLVFIDEPRLAGHAYVGIDDRGGARMAAEHLLELGHERVAILSERAPIGDEPHRLMASEIVGERLDGYREALAAAGTDWAGLPRVEAPENRIERGLEAGRALLALTPRPTAILAVTDLLAMGVLQAAHERGLDLPADLSVVGFDDVPAAAWTSPGLTTVRQPLLEKGEAAGRLMIAEDDGAAREIELPVELVVRGSTGPPA